MPFNVVLGKVLMDVTLWRHGATTVLLQPAPPAAISPGAARVLVDGSWNPVTQTMGCGVIIKDAIGCWVSGLSMRFGRLSRGCNTAGTRGTRMSFVARIAQGSCMFFNLWCLRKIYGPEMTLRGSVRCFAGNGGCVWSRFLVTAMLQRTCWLAKLQERDHHVEFGDFRLPP